MQLSTFGWQFLNIRPLVKNKPLASSDGGDPWVSLHQGYRSTRHTMQGSTTTQWGGGFTIQNAVRYHLAILKWGYRSIRNNPRWSLKWIQQNGFMINGYIYKTQSRAGWRPKSNRRSSILTYTCIGCKLVISEWLELCSPSCFRNCQLQILKISIKSPF